MRIDQCICKLLYNLCKLEETCISSVHQVLVHSVLCSLADAECRSGLRSRSQAQDSSTVGAADKWAEGRASGLIRRVCISTM